MGRLTMTSVDRKPLLALLPAVDLLLTKARAVAAFQNTPRAVLVAAIRNTLDTLRRDILTAATPPTPQDLNETALLSAIGQTLAREETPSLRRLVNATGVVIHTNLGRSPLAESVITHMSEVARGYSNLEYDLATGRRGSRYSIVSDLLCDLTGAESAMVVNNNAAAVLLCLDTIARGKEAVVSRGELVEIGGAFRVPDVMAKSGALLREVGTTNRTHLKDYEGAITSETGLLLKVHTSNFKVVGFTAAVSLGELVALGRRFQLPVMEDLGSGTFVDLRDAGLDYEPTVRESVAAGTDIVTFSGDKLLGGPQAGIIVGREAWLHRIQKNPLTRALRIDKLTLAALEGTLLLYRDEQNARNTVPTLRMLTLSRQAVTERADRLGAMLSSICPEKLTVVPMDKPGKAGGGALPATALPSRCLGIRVAGMSPDALECALRKADPPIIGRIDDDLFLLDLRTVLDDEMPLIAKALGRLFTL